MSMLFTRMASPVGDLLLAGHGDELSALWIDGQRWAPVIGADWRESGEAFGPARAQLGEYFARERTTFDLPLRFAGTPFQNAVWRALTRIPYGETRTYGVIAAGLGRPRAARAVGAANGRNPFCIVVPCHRLIGSDGGLVDYAAGLDVKRRLIEHEADVRRRRAAASRPAHTPSPLRGWPGNQGPAPPSAAP
ncbi:MAG TPA: methylated-DNA--[protein]-cysteine S-methyltransferase [Solirubrobacteraceae bacterium]|jgi:methylated-DNA-[protein]-cysteine S-methyltransferase|nr:methylated-DNA--[protein]-cysteine S-methyltransferase [Solirubrobacteraceae bacterium]